MQPIIEDKLVDARDLMCPMPVMAATRAMRRLAPGQVLKVLATDRGSLADIPAWAEENGDVLLSSEEGGGVFIFLVRKAADAVGLLNDHISHCVMAAARTAPEDAAAQLAEMPAAIRQVLRL